MVAVLMGDQNAVDMVGTRAAQRLKPPQHFLFSKSSVDEESRAPRFEQRGVARAAGGQNGYAERDSISPVLASERNSSECRAAMDNGKLRHARQHEVADTSSSRSYSSAKIARTYADLWIFCGSNFVSGLDFGVARSKSRNIPPPAPPPPPAWASKRRAVFEA